MSRERSLVEVSQELTSQNDQVGAGEITTKNKGKKIVEKTIKQSGNTVVDEVDEYEIIPKRTSTSIKGFVGIEGSQTINTGNYNSLRIGVIIILPTDIDDKSINATIKKCQSLVDQTIKEELDNVKPLLNQ